MTVALAITGPGVHDVVTTALHVYAEVAAGRFSAAVALMPDRFTDPVAAATAFDALAAPKPPAPADDCRVVGAGDQVCYAGPGYLLNQAMDLYMRLHLGQFAQLAWVSGRADFDAVTRLRVELQKPDAWPRHPSASWSIHNQAEVPDRARVAYDVWKYLGGGITGRPPIHGGVTIQVHRPPEGPNEDVALCPTCGSVSYAMRPDGETYGDHLPDCALPRRHESHCQPGGPGHPTAPVIRGYWPDRCDNPDPHAPHEHYGKPAALRRDCPGRRGEHDTGARPVPPHPF